MPKVSFEAVAEVLAANNLDNETISKVLKELEAQAQAELEEAKASREPAVKKQWVMVVSDPRGTLPDEDYVGWVAQIPEDDSPAETLPRIIAAAHEFNISKKGRKYPVKSIGEACEAVSAKFMKEQGVVIKTKLPVTVLRTDNALPDPPEEFDGVM